MAEPVATAQPVAHNHQAQPWVGVVGAVEVGIFLIVDQFDALHGGVEHWPDDQQYGEVAQPAVHARLRGGTLR